MLGRDILRFNRSRRIAGIAVIAGLALLIASCTRVLQEPDGDEALRNDAITIGSFDFAESELLAEIYARALERSGFKVNRMFRIGPREVVQPALSTGLLEFIPEYSGTALQFLSLGRSKPVSDVDATHDALSEALVGSPAVALEPSPAQDANAFVVTQKTAQRYGLTTISDLKDVAPKLVLGGPPECPTRPLCLLGLEEAYGLRFGGFLPLDAGGPLTEQAIDDGYADVAVMFTTHPRLTGRDLIALKDDLDLQPAENVTPLVREEIVERWGATFEEVVNTVSKRISTRALRQLNAEIAAGTDSSTVAEMWLTSQGRQP
jgi:osmoprotectant transport system substrate-binding protein